MVRSHSIRQRLHSAILVPTILAVALSVGVFTLLEWKLSLKDQTERLETAAGLVAENSSPALAFLNAEDAQRVLSTLRAEASVRDAVLFDREGKTFAVYRSATSSRPLPTAPGPTGVVREPGRLAIFEPVVQAERVYGTLFLRWDLRPWYVHMRSYVLAGLAIVLASGVLGVVIGRILERRISTPVLRLAETAAAVADHKNYRVRVDRPGTDELDVLATAFNHMLDAVQESQNRLAAEAESTRRAEQQLRLVTDATPALISYIDPATRYRFVNQQYQVWFGHPKEHYLGRTMAEVLGTTTFERVRPYFERALQGETSTFEVEAPYTSGGARWIHADYIPHISDAGETLGVVVLVMDLTDRRRIEASLSQAHAELEQYSRTLETRVEERTAKLREAVGELEAFSYSIAHDMRAPLRSMQGYSRLLIEEHGSALDSEAQTFLQRIVASADRLDQLIQDVLNYSRVVRQEIQLEPVDTQQLLENIIATYPNLQAHQSRIRLEGPLPRVNGNTAALTQVFSNLLGNAVKFVKPGQVPQVRIHSEPAPDAPAEEPAVRLWIEDNGIGIPAEAQKRLFGMFQRLHRPELYEGTGIGLAIVRKAMERMGGRVGVDSLEGRGTRFWIELRLSHTP